MARMKLILTQEVDGLGAPGDVVDVAAGYGRNYLMPRGFGITWTRGGEKQVDLIKRARSAREIRTMEDAQSVAGRLQKLTVRVKRRAGSNGRLFGSVGASDIAAALKDAGGPEIDKRTIVVPDPIKSAGEYRVQVRLHPEVTASVNVEVSGVLSTALGCVFHSGFHRGSFSTGRPPCPQVPIGWPLSVRERATRRLCIPLRAPG